jgi:DNA invertase Pin-like site-specific DNA recombinase
MPNRNVHEAKSVILYMRVSTEEQAPSSYSLAQQLEALGSY